MDQPKYHIDIFWSDEDGGYIANVPDLRYCSAFGETYEDALREVLVAMELHLDTLRELDRPIPEPGAHRGVGVSALVLESGQTIELQEGGSGGFLGVGFASEAVDTARAGEVAEDVGQGAGQIAEGIGEGAGQAVEDIGEGAGQLGGYILEYDEDEDARSTRRSGRSGNQ